MLKSLFPVNYWHTNIQIAEEIKKKLLDKIEEEYTGEYSTPEAWNCNIFSSIDFCSNVNYEELIKYIKDEYEKYCSSISLNPHSYTIRDIWYNYSVKNSFQEYHEHSTSRNGIPNYSGVYYLKIEEEHSSIRFKNPCRDSYFFSIYKPEIMDLHKPENVLSSSSFANFTLNITEGDLIIFPSWFEHEVPVQKIDSPRISISFNIDLNACDDLIN